MELSEIKNLHKAPFQGGSLSVMYEGEYNGEPVVVKVQEKHSDNSEHYRFNHELDVLAHEYPGVVKFIDWGNNFLVLEKLYDTPFNQDAIDFCIKTAVNLYISHGVIWTPSDKHIKVDKDGSYKLLDFNDECDLDNFVTKLYQVLKDVHQPVWCWPKDLMRTENGNMVPPNRECIDRSKMIMRNIGVGPGTCLDIGCNVGWFSFFMSSLGYETTGIDMDKNKIMFARLISSINEENPTFETAELDLEYAKQMPQYDTILALSILHLPVMYLGMTPDYWLNMFEAICSKVNKTFIFEVSPGLYNYVSHRSVSNVLQKFFSNAEVIGISDNKRELIKATK